MRVRLSTRGYYRATHGATASNTRESAERSADVHENSSSASASPEEQVVLLFACGALVVIDAFDLLQAVRALRSRRARELASLDVASDSEPHSHSHLAPSYRRYLVDDYADARDFAIGAACVRQTRFEQLCAASLVGAREQIRATPPAHSALPALWRAACAIALLRLAGSASRLRLAAASARRVLARAHTLSQVCLVVALRHLAGVCRLVQLHLQLELELQLGSCATQGAIGEDDSSAAALRLPRQCARGSAPVCALLRRVARAVLPLVALVDNLSRVLLLDPRSGLVARVFKGYRDCQAGWIFVRECERQPPPALAASDSEPVDASLSVESDEAPEASDARVAQCLVLYAPKRGLVEVWLGSHGPRVAAFNVSPDGALLSTEHGCLGLGALHAPAPAAAERSLLSSSHTFFMSPGGQLLRVCVPFETLVQRDRGVRLADAQLLRRLNCVLDEVRASAELDASLAFDEALIANHTYVSLERALCELFVQFSSPAQASRALARVCACERLHVSTVSSLALRLRERFRRASGTCEPQERSRCSELTCLEQQIQRVLSVAQLFALCSDAQHPLASRSPSPSARAEATLTGAAFASARCTSCACRAPTRRASSTCSSARTSSPRSPTPRLRLCSRCRCRSLCIASRSPLCSAASSSTRA